MKTFNYFATLTALMISTSVFAAGKYSSKQASQNASAPTKEIDFSKDVDGLGGNEDLMTMANTLNPEAKSRIVQDRIVDRRNRLEFGVNYGGTFGGPTYLETQNLGASVDFHFTPRWAIGARYYDYGNKLTPEGDRRFQEARVASTTQTRYSVVDVDVPYNSKMAIISWFPIYGKTNFFDMAIAQFDMYILAGGGQITLNSGDTSIMTGGLGVGLWMTRHLTARAELRFQTYEDQIITGPRTINAAAATVGLGWIL